MSVLTDNQKKTILANDSACVGVLLVCYRILVILYIVASMAPNFAVQRDPVVGQDPTISRFTALPHVIWMISPIVMLAYAERARLLNMFGDRRAAKNLVRRMWWVIVFVLIDIFASAIHFAGFLAEGVIGTSPLFSDPSTQALVWVGVGFTLFQFLWGIFILCKFVVFRGNLRVALKQGLPFTNSSIEDGGQATVPTESLVDESIFGGVQQKVGAVLGIVGIGNAVTKGRRNH